MLYRNEKQNNKIVLTIFYSQMTNYADFPMPVDALRAIHWPIETMQFEEKKKKTKHSTQTEIKRTIQIDSFIEMTKTICNNFNNNLSGVDGKCFSCR